MHRARLLKASALVLFCFALYLYIPGILRPRQSYHLLGPDAKDVVEAQRDAECYPFNTKLMKGLTIVVKTGNGEDRSRLSVYTDMHHKCKQDLLIFADFAGDSNGVPIEDAFAHLSKEYLERNPDFDTYRTLQGKEAFMSSTGEGWHLDKYKYLPMVERARLLRPKSAWFVFVELDSYVKWDTMQRFLAQFDSRKPYYIGAAVSPPKKPAFAYGGSAFVLSGAALDKLRSYSVKLAAEPGTHQFGVDLSTECCGDQVLGSVLKEAGVTLSGYGPMFNGETPHTCRFGPKQWCEPIITMHHMSAVDFEKLESWESDQQWQPGYLSRYGKPLTFERLFDYIDRGLSSRKNDWTNLPEDVELQGDAGRSYGSCLAACGHDPLCFQFEQSPGICRLSYSIRRGHEHEAKDGVAWTSGWMLQRIKAFKAENICEGVHMVHANS